MGWDWLKKAGDIGAAVATGGAIGGWGAPPPSQWGGGGGGKKGGGGDQISGSNDGRGGPQFAPPGQGGPEWDAAVAGNADPYWDDTNFSWEELAEATKRHLAEREKFGLDDPGTGEQYTADTADFFKQPTQGGQYWNQVAGKFNAPAANWSNRADEWYQQFKGQVPNMPDDAGLGGYYDEAKRRTSEDINSQLAARGLFGSSEGVGMLGEALTGLEAERANREADYRLRKTAEDRMWQQLGGGLARGGDLSEQGMAGQELAYLLGGANVAGAADRSDLARVLGGADVAFRGQGAREGRLGDRFNRTYGMGADTRDFLQSGYEHGFAQDERLLGDVLEALLAQYGFDYSAGQRQQEQNNAGLAMVLDFASGMGWLS